LVRASSLPPNAFFGARPLVNAAVIEMHRIPPFIATTIGSAAKKDAVQESLELLLLQRIRAGASVLL
jgi:hypothetical protein